MNPRSMEVSSLNRSEPLDGHVFLAKESMIRLIPRVKFSTRVESVSRYSPNVSESILPLLRSMYSSRRYGWSWTDVRSPLTQTLTLARPWADYPIEYAGPATRAHRRIQPSAYMPLSLPRPSNSRVRQCLSKRRSRAPNRRHAGPCYTWTELTRSEPPLPRLCQPLDQQHSWTLTRKRQEYEEGISLQETRQESMAWLGNNNIAAVQTSMSPRLNWTSGSRDGTSLCIITTQACTACTSPHSAAPQAPIPPCRPATHTARDRP
jgi:hypothetical protein